MKYIPKSLWLCIVVLLLPPTTTHAELTGEVIFLHPRSDFTELWIGDVKNTRNARQIFKHTPGVEELAVQSEGQYIVFVSQIEEAFFAFDAYVIDRNKFPLKAHNFTQQRFDTIWDIDISHKGDVVFTNYDTGREPDMKYGVYLIRREELETGFPNAELIFEREAYEVTWAPDGVHIAFHVFGGGIYLYNTEYRGGASVIDQHGYNPAFSPDGKRLAFVQTALGQGAAITAISLHPRRRLKTLALDADVAILDLKWTPDGQALVYTVNGPDHLYHTYAAHLDEGPHEEVLKIGDAGVPMFDWTNAAAYAVEPTNRLTTLWGKLKQQDSK